MNSRQMFVDLKEEITRVEDSEFVEKPAIHRISDRAPNTPSTEHFRRGRHHMDIGEASARPLRRRRCIIVAVVVVCLLLVSAAVAAGLAVTLSKHAGETESSTGKTSTLSLNTSRTAEIPTTTTSTTTTRVSTKPYTTTFTTGTRRSSTISATATDNIIFNNTTYTRATNRTITTFVSPTASDSTTSPIVSTIATVGTSSTIVSTTTTDSTKGTIVLSTTTSKTTQPTTTSNSITVFTSPTTTASSDSGATVPALMTTATSREVGDQTMMKITATITPTKSLTSPKTSPSRQTHLPKTTETKRRDKIGTFHWTKRTRITTTPSQG